MGSGEERALTGDGEPAYAYGKVAGLEHLRGDGPGRRHSPSPDGDLVARLAKAPHLPPRRAPGEGAPPASDGAARRERPARPPQLPLRDGCRRADSPRRAPGLRRRDGKAGGGGVAADSRASPLARSSSSTRGGARTASRVYFIDLARGCQSCRLCELDVATGAVRPILEERSETYLELNPATWAQPNVRILGAGKEVIWFSERDGWGHLYLHDGRTGELVRQITSGEWLVRDIIRVDEEARRVYFTACGREPGRDPYHRHLYRVRPGRLRSHPADAGGRRPPGRDSPRERDRGARADGAPGRPALRLRLLAFRPLLRRHLVADGRAVRLGAPLRRGRARLHARDGRRERRPRGGLALARALPGEGPRRRDRPLRGDLPALALRPRAALPGDRHDLPGTPGHPHAEALLPRSSRSRASTTRCPR